MADAGDLGGPTADEVTEAYVYLLGRYLVIRQEAIDVAEPGGGYNVLKHNPPVNAGDTAGSAPTFVNPNLDVVYSEAWLAVDADTPVILEIPEIPAGLVLHRPDRRRVGRDHPQHQRTQLPRPPRRAVRDLPAGLDTAPSRTTASGSTSPPARRSC